MNELDYVAVAESQRLEGQHHDALVTLLRGLSENPTDNQGRLLLARVFFELDCVPFAVNELKTLCRRFPANSSLQKLYKELGGGTIEAEGSSAAEVVAESEIDFDAIEELERE